MHNSYAVQANVCNRCLRFIPIKTKTMKMKLKYDIMVDVALRRYFETKRSGRNDEENEINNSRLNFFTPRVIQSEMPESPIARFSGDIGAPWL